MMLQVQMMQNDNMVGVVVGAGVVSQTKMMETKMMEEVVYTNRL